MNTQRALHPRAGLAIGAVLLTGWLGVIGAAIASDSSTETASSAAPKAPETGTPVARPGRAGPGYDPPTAD
jgi:hypothetical protein